MRRHVNADTTPDGFDDLVGECVLALGLSASSDKKIAVRIGLEARQNVLAVPAKPTGNMIGDFGGEVVFLRLRLCLRDMEQQLPFQAIRLEEVFLPVQPTEVLRPERDSELDLDGYGHLGLDEVDFAHSQFLCDLRDQPFRQEHKLLLAAG